LSYPHPIENIMRTTMEQLREMADVNTIVGDPLLAGDGTMILPVSKVSLGFLSGGGEYSKGESIVRRKENVEFVDDIRHPFAGSSAAGVSLTPMAFLVVGCGSVKVLPAQVDNTLDRALEMIPRTIEEVSSLLRKNKKQSTDGQESACPAQSPLH
jgi:sporulation protein YtfJ